MKKQIKNISACLLCFVVFCVTAIAQEQDSTETPAPQRKAKPVKNSFESIWLIDNQTVMVPAKKTFEMDIMHRFGTMKNGYDDFFGFFAPSNIRLGFNYVPIDNLLIGAALTKENMVWEAYGKYALLKQTKGVYPVSVTYYGDIAIKTREAEYRYFSDRLSFFNQLLIARKFTEKLTLQLAPSLSHINVVNGVYKISKTTPDSVTSTVVGEMKHNHLAIAFSGRYKLSDAMALIANYDQPLTKHPARNPNPNISFGIEVATSAHAFQFFVGNYYFITPQQNNYFNRNDPAAKKPYKQFLIGFNITRLWSY